ncbi:LYR motif-containing protein 2 isoform X2 [Lathamus discolor]|uniref:LYR motif-containing protein 2 isoform X2 n=1 Tax=Lathamus discolor TaxID=678569 RepID=UPI0032B82ED9
MAAGTPRPPRAGSAATGGEAAVRVMAASRLPPGALSLKQFLRRQQVLQLYRKILRAIREVPAEADRRYLKDWAREEFRRNKDARDEDAIRMMITQGNMQLQELQRTLKLAKS